MNSKYFMFFRLKVVLLALMIVPSSENYQLDSFFVGGGGRGDSTNFSLSGQIGDQGGIVESENFTVGGGLVFVRQANRPKALSFENPDNYYDKLKLVIDRQDNPGDAKYAVAISSDDFATQRYVQSDMTVDDELGMEDYLTFQQWGGEDGVEIIGLEQNTNYTIKIKAIKGKFTESDWGVSSTASTVSLLFAFDIDVSDVDEQTTPPYQIDLGDLYPNSLVVSTDKIWASVETNGNNGVSVFVYGQNGGLQSVNSGFLISAVTGNLGSLDYGFGIQGADVSQLSGWPVVFESGYTGYTGNDGFVGLVDGNVRRVAMTNGPVLGGRVSFVVKAKANDEVPASGDYSESVTLIASVNY